MFAAHGAVVLQSDAIGRELMQPGQMVYAEVIRRFGPMVVLVDGSLDRPQLARLAFEQGRVEELNAIVHPAVIARQEQLIAEIVAHDESAVVIVESALIFETRYAGAAGWRGRFDKLVLVTAPEALKIVRFVERAGVVPETRTALEAEGRRRLAAQMPDKAKVPFCDFVVSNDGSLLDLEAQVESVWQSLIHAS